MNPAPRAQVPLGVKRRVRGRHEQGTRMSNRMSCPSAQPKQEGSVVIGVVATVDGKHHVSHLPRQVPLESVAHLIPNDIPITEILRFAAPCVERCCAHYREDRCTLAARIVACVPASANSLSPCAIRPSCRWWRQEGPAACHRCPQIVTEPLHPSELMREIAIPPRSITSTN